jgi:hypothetical protein
MSHIKDSTIIVMCVAGFVLGLGLFVNGLNTMLGHGGVRADIAELRMAIGGFPAQLDSIEQQIHVLQEDTLRLSSRPQDSQALIRTVELLGAKVKIMDQMWLSNMDDAVSRAEANVEQLNHRVRRVEVEARDAALAESAWSGYLKALGRIMELTNDR